MKGRMGGRIERSKERKKKRTKKGNKKKQQILRGFIHRFSNFLIILHVINFFTVQIVLEISCLVNNKLQEKKERTNHVCDKISLPIHSMVYVILMHDNDVIHASVERTPW